MSLSYPPCSEKDQVMSGCCRLSKAAAVVHAKASVSKAAAVLHAKAPVQVLIQSEPYGLAPYAGLLSPEDPLTISPGCQYPLLLGSRSPLTVSHFPTLHFYLADSFDHGRFKSVWRLRPCSLLSVHTPWTLWLGGHDNGLAYPSS